MNDFKTGNEKVRLGGECPEMEGRINAFISRFSSADDQLQNMHRRLTNVADRLMGALPVESDEANMKDAHEPPQLEQLERVGVQIGYSIDRLFEVVRRLEEL